MVVSAPDLPQVWQKPAFQVLLGVLQELRVDPPVWNLKISRTEIQKEQDTTVQHRREIATYLSSIIKSGLVWIEDEEDREIIWEEASKRLSERCGRSGRCRCLCFGRYMAHYISQLWVRSSVAGPLRLLNTCPSIWSSKSHP